MDQLTFSLRRLMPQIWCAALVLAIWGIVGWYLHATPGWLAVVTGGFVGINAWLEPRRENGRQLKLLDVAAMAMFCWALIIAGRFVSNVSGVNHSVVWLAHRPATDEDGIGILAADISEERVDTPLTKDATIQSPSTITAQSKKDLSEARIRWKSLSTKERSWLLDRWRVTVDGANQMAWSMIRRNSFTVAYEGTNLFWHLTGMAIAVGLIAISSLTKISCCREFVSLMASKKS